MAEPTKASTEVTTEVLLRALADCVSDPVNEIHEIEYGVTLDLDGANPTVLGVPVMAGWRVFLLNYL